MKTKLRFAVPNGSLSERLQMYCATAGYPLQAPDRTGFCGEAGGVLFYQLDRRMIPHFLKSGDFDAGITGFDLWLNSGVRGLREIASLTFSRKTDQPTRWVLVKRTDWKSSNGGIVRIACELPRLARRLLRDVELPQKWKLIEIEGSEELCAKHHVSDLVLTVTETGKSLVANGLEILPGCDRLLVSTPRILARNKLSTERERRLQELTLALQSVVGAHEYVMVMCDMPDGVDVSSLDLHPSVAPTVSPLTKAGWHALTVCIPRTEFGCVAFRLKAVGAKGIVMCDVQAHIE